jgi:pyruvate kinase
VIVAETANPGGTARPPQGRRTKIVATIGPASDDPDVLRAMAAAGMDVARVTLAHGTVAEAIDRIRRLRQVVPAVGILADLPGPKIRTSPFPDGGVLLSPGDPLLLVDSAAAPESSATHIGVSSETLVAGLEVGDALALGDGGVSLVVVQRTPEGVVAEVRSGGLLQGRPGVTAPTVRFSLPTPTPDDLERVDALVGEGVDAIAISFVRSAADILAVKAAAERRVERQAGSHVPMLVAKVETAEAVADLDAIVAVAGGVMVARGDLGVRLALEEVPHIQRRIIRSAVHYGRPVITATQMLESMVSAHVPTRAEVSDVANAVRDGTSAVMLSAETAIGHDPARVVATMSRIARRAEQEFDYIGWGEDVGVQQVIGNSFSPARITAATTSAAWRAAIDEDAAAILACTRSGATARAISRFRPSMPIVAVTPSERTARQLTLSWGVEALVVRESRSTDDIVWFAVEAAVKGGYARSGEVVVVLAGSPIEAEPATDTMRLVRIR